MAPPTSYIMQADLQAALNPGTFLQCFDDDNDGSVDDDDPNVAQVIRRAHSEVLSYLPRVYDGLPNATPTLLFSAELDYALAFSFDRHPEFAKTYGTEQRDSAWKRAEGKMERVANSIQQLTDNAPAAAPATEGGIVCDPNPRHVICDSADGTSNSGDF